VLCESSCLCYYAYCKITDAEKLRFVRFLGDKTTAPSPPARCGYMSVVAVAYKLSPVSDAAWINYGQIKIKLNWRSDLIGSGSYS